MFCQKCGRPVEEGQTICSECAAAEAAEAEKTLAEAIAEPPVETAAVEPAAEAPGFTVYTDTELPKKKDKKKAEKPAKKKKSNKKVLAIVLSVVAVLTAAAIMTTALCWPYVASFFKRNLMKPDAYLQSVALDALGEDPTVDMVGTCYDKFLAYLKQPVKPQEYALSVEFSDECMGMIESAIADEDVKLDWLDKLDVNVTTGMNGMTAGASVDLTLNDTEVLRGELILDILQQTMYLGAPELNSDYISGEADLTGAVYFLSLFATMQENGGAEELPDRDAVETLIKKYMTMVIEELAVTEKTTETITIDGLSRKCTVLEAELTQEQTDDLMIGILEDAKEDKTAQALLKVWCDAANDLAKQQAGAEYKEENAQTPEKLLDAMIQLVKDRDHGEGKGLVIKTYVDMKDQVCGHRVETADGDNVFCCFALEEDANWERTFRIGEDVYILGIGEESEQSLNGTYTVEVKDETYLRCELQDVDKAALKSGQLLGTVKLVLGDALAQDVASNFLDPSMSSLAGLAKPALEIKLAENTANISVQLMGKTFVTAGITAKEGGEYRPEVPDAALAGDIAGVAKWAQGVDFAAFFETLRTAKVPEEYVGEMEDLVSMFILFAPYR